MATFNARYVTPVFRENLEGEPIEIDFYIGDSFTIVPFINALDPLRIANNISGKKLFRWRLLSDDGKPVRAINDMVFPVDAAIRDISSSSNVFLFIGFDPIMELPRELATWLRGLVVQGAHLGAAGAGSLFLAQAGLLNGYSATIHWNYRESFAEEFPQVTMSRNIYEIDRNRFTCAGGTATMTMMLHAIASHYSHDLASEVADLFIAGELSTRDPDHMKLRRARIGVKHTPLNSVIDAMETHIEHPLTIVELANNAGLSQRQLGRMFRLNFQRTPVHYYVELRIQHGRRLLQQTDMPVTEVALASGFSSPEHFSRKYRALIGISPTEDRRRSRYHHQIGDFEC